MSALAFTVAVASSAHGGERIGRTITSFMPLSAEPPLLMISIDTSSRMVDLIAASRRFSVAALSRARKRSPTFSRGRETCRIGFRSASGIPGLQEALGLPGRYSPLIASSSAPLMPPTTSCLLAPSPNRSRIPHAKPCFGAIAPIPAERRGASDPGFPPRRPQIHSVFQSALTLPQSGETLAVNYGILQPGRTQPATQYLPQQIYYRAFRHITVLSSLNSPVVDPFTDG